MMLDILKIVVLWFVMVLIGGVFGIVVMVVLIIVDKFGFGDGLVDVVKVVLVGQLVMFE